MQMTMETHESYKVNLAVFEGPLDLLLHLVRKNDLDIYDIPISFITEEYLKYIEAIEKLNINVASDFLDMAAELSLMKSRSLLPAEALQGEVEEEGIDPRLELARRLIEYQKFKIAARLLMRREMLGRDLFTRSLIKANAEGEEDAPIQGEVYQLMLAFSKVLARAPKDVYHNVAVDRLSVTDRIYQIVDVLNEKSSVLLAEVLPDPITRYDVVVTFLALLEMSRLKMIRVYQEEQFGEIAIRKAMEVLKLEEDIGDETNHTSD